MPSEEREAEGPFTEFYPNGKKQMVGCYSNRYRTGTWSYWDATGKLIYSVEFVNGKKTKVYKDTDENASKPF